jgi:CubicO group peptidase (beta-lactamase class C family)
MMTNNNATYPLNMDTLRDILDNSIKEGKIPGAQLAVFSDNKISYCEAGNISGFNASSPVERSTLYDVASLTKVVVTTTLTLIAIQNGKLNFDDKVITFFPSFRHPQVTIHHLLTHTSGLSADDKKYRVVKDKAGMLEFILKKDLEFQTGTRVEYTDFGFILLGFILETIYMDLEYAAIMKIFAPLGMKSTCFNPHQKGWGGRCAPTEIQAERGIIQGFVHDGKAFRMGGVSGNAGLFSNASDLLKFAMSFLSESSGILTKETLDQLREQQTLGLNLKRTYGWQISDPGICHFGNFPSKHVLFHTGFTGTSIYIDFDRNVAIVLLSNRFLPDPDNLGIKEIRTNIHDTILSRIPSTNE